MEIWKPLYNFKRYEISNIGRVRRTEIRKLSVNSVGYNSVHLSQDKHQRKISIHRAVWESFNGKIPPEMMINHKNGIKTDNRLENLEVVTNRENIEHYKNNLLTYRGEKVNTAKLTEEDVREIRKKSDSGWSTARLMRDYGVAKTTINRIISGRNWKHVF